MRSLGIDHGRKRVGLALSDESMTLAFPYKTLPNNKKLVEQIRDICQKEKVDLIEIGKSQTLSGEDNPIMKDIKDLKEKISEITSIQIHLEPEFFTTREAMRIQGKKVDIDASAAALILQRFLEKHNFKGTEI